MKDKSKRVKGVRSGGVRMDLVKKYRKQINEKTYKIKSSEIAEKMASDIFNNKSYSTFINSKT